MSVPQHLTTTVGIMRYLPHRYPFLMVDRVVSIVPNESIHAYKNVSINEPFFQGHFPGKPVMPGVLILEALAQTGGLLVTHDMDEELLRTKTFLFTSIENARFRNPVMPGDRLDLEVRLVRQKFKLWKIAGVATVDGKLAAEAELTAAITDAEV